MTFKQRCMLIGTTVAMCVAVDQLTKYFAKAHLTLTDMHSMLGDTVRLQLAHNTGAFLSLGASLPPDVRQWVFSFGVAILLIAVIVYALRSQGLSRLSIVSLALIFAGGASNLGDRLVYGGYVVDYMQVGIGWLRTGVFNVADMAIMAGTFMLLFDAFRHGKSEANA